MTARIETAARRIFSREKSWIRLSQRMVEVRHMRPNESSAVALLHAEEITGGFLNKLGLRFLACLYRCIEDEESSHVWIARENNDIIGFCAYARNVGGLYKRVLRKRFFRLALASLPRSLNPWVVKEMVDTLRYPAKQHARQLPDAEILSIAVRARGQGRGIGKRLMEEVLAQATGDGEAEIKVVAGADLARANRFYISCGFDKCCEIEQHGHVLHAYVKRLQPHDL